jgi:GNAT superfamily N-acetyltransferase
MRSEIAVRFALPSDAEQIASVLIESRKTYLPYAPSAHTEEETRAWVAAYLLPLENVLVVVTDGRIVGIASTRCSGEVSWISQMYVAPGYVGKGIGSLLLEQSLKRLVRPVRLYTFQQNIGARRFYERKGFVEINLSDGSDNEERCPSVLYELPAELKIEPNQSSDPAFSSGTSRAGQESRHP